MSKNSRNYGEILGQMIATLEAALINLKINKEEASSISIQCVEAIRHTWGGMQLYIPKELSMLTEERNEKIKKDFDGDNQFQLSRRYRLSVQQVYSILKED